MAYNVTAYINFHLKFKSIHPRTQNISKFGKFFMFCSGPRKEKRKRKEEKGEKRERKKKEKRKREKGEGGEKEVRRW